MPSLGPTELIIVLVLVIIVFGVGKLPEVGGALGKSIKEFRKANDEAEIKKEDEATIAAKEAERKRKEAKQPSRQGKPSASARKRRQPSRRGKPSEGAMRDRARSRASHARA